MQFIGLITDKSKAGTLAQVMPGVDARDVSVQHVFRILKLQIDKDYDFYRRGTAHLGQEEEVQTEKIDFAEEAKLSPKEQLEKQMNEFVQEYQVRFARQMKEEKEKLVSELKIIQQEQQGVLLQRQEFTEKYLQEVHQMQVKDAASLAQLKDCQARIVAENEAKMQAEISSERRFQELGHRVQEAFRLIAEMGRRRVIFSTEGKRDPGEGHESRQQDTIFVSPRHPVDCDLNTAGTPFTESILPARTPFS